MMTPSVARTCRSGWLRATTCAWVAASPSGCPASSALAKAYARFDRPDPGGLVMSQECVMSCVAVAASGAVAPDTAAPPSGTGTPDTAAPTPDTAAPPPDTAAPVSSDQASCGDDAPTPDTDAPPPDTGTPEGSAVKPDIDAATARRSTATAAS